MIQQIRSNKLLPASTITKLLRNTAPDLPAAVTGFVRIKGIASASVILRLLQSTDVTSTGYIITPDGDILFNPDGNYEETPDHA